MASVSVKLEPGTHDELDSIPLQQRFKLPKIESPCCDDVQGEANRPKISPTLQLINEFITKEEIDDILQWKLTKMKIETEKKSFEFNWTGLVGQSLVSIQERTQRGIVTKECGLWLADRMLALVMTKGTEDGQSNHKRDHHTIVVLSVEGNQHGRFAKVHITPTSSMGRNVCIRIPEDEGGAGWRKVAEGLKIFIDGSLPGISLGKPACNKDAINNQNAGKWKIQSHLIDREKSNFRNDSHEIAKDDASSIVTTSSFDSSSSKIALLPCVNPQYPQNGCDSQECLSPKTSNSPKIQENGNECLLQAIPMESKPPVGQEVVPSDANNIRASALPIFLANVKVETLEGGSESQPDNIKGEATNMVAVKGEIGTWEESYEDVMDHMPLRQRKELLFARSAFKLDTSKNLKRLRKSLPSAFECNPNVSKTGKVKSVIRQPKRKKTATDSVETALEEDAPGLLKVLVDKGILVDEIKLYGADMESEDPLDISSEEESFADLETVVSKLFSQRSSFLKFAPLHSMKATKPSYCLVCLLSLVEQTRYLQFRKWHVEWGWCRDLQSFIFVFERHNRIVLERPEYGYATYFFELVDCLPIDWQIKRLVTAMKLTSCSRTTLIENKSLLVGEDMTEGEARVLEEYGWAPNTGLGSMLNYCDRVVHDRKNDENVSEWRSKIGKLLTNGLEGGTITLSHLPKKFKGNMHTRVSAEALKCEI